MIRAWALIARRGEWWVGIRAVWQRLELQILPGLGIAIELGEPTCWCGYDDERHGPVRECTAGPEGSCPAPEDHHRFEVAPLWRRRRQSSWL